jgi:GNAT superfamily N-acetyltransferase
VVHEPASHCEAVIHIRPLAKDAAGDVDVVFEKLSTRSRWFRFHAATPRLTQRYRAALSAVASENRAGFVAWARGEPVGIGRWDRVPDMVSCAEISLAVADDWQGRGIGRALLCHVITDASASGITRVVAHVHPEHRLMRDWLVRLGAEETDLGFVLSLPRNPCSLAYGSCHGRGQVPPAPGEEPRHKGDRRPPE